MATGMRVVVPRISSDYDGGDGFCHLERFEPPTKAAPGHVLVRVLRTTASYCDLNSISSGFLPPGYGELTFPITPGYELVGTILALGEGVAAFAVGDLVAALLCHKGMTTHLEVAADDLFRVPPGVSANDAVAVIMTGVVAYQLLHREVGDRLKMPNPMASILVHGCTGGTGAMIVKLAKQMGVGTIVGTCAARNLEAARAEGVIAIDYNANGQEWAEAVRIASPKGKGVTVVFDPVCSSSYLAKDVACLAPNGKLCAYGFTNSTAPGAVSMPSVIATMVQVQMRHFVYSWFDSIDAGFYGARSHGENRAQYGDTLAAVFELVRKGQLNLADDGGREWPLAEAALALTFVAGGKHRGKQIINCEKTEPCN